MLLELFFMVCSFIVLYKASTYLIDSSIKVAGYFRLPEFFIGFMILAVGTSLPELSIAAVSSMIGEPNISIGNVVGANIVDVTFVLGIAAIMYKRIRLQSEHLLKDMFITIFLSIAPLVLIVLFVPNRFFGFLFILMFIYYLLRIRGEKEFKKEVVVGTREAVIAGAVLIPSLVMVVFSSYLATLMAKAIAQMFSISPFLVGMTVISLGTTLPELSTTIVALKKKYSYLAWGNIMGSLVTNSTLVLGTVFSLSGTTFRSLSLYPAVGLLLIIEIMLMLITRMDKEIRRVDGFSFLLIYFFYVILEFLINV
jgi:cation:H+ antiporter